MNRFGWLVLGFGGGAFTMTVLMARALASDPGLERLQELIDEAAAKGTPGDAGTDDDLLRACPCGCGAERHRLHEVGQVGWLS